MKDATLLELAATWELQASTGGDGLNMLQPATRETLRQCADVLRMLVDAQSAASSPAPAVPDDPEQHPDFYAWTWDVWVSGGRWRSDFGWKRPSGTVPARNIKAVYTRPAPSPAPAVQLPTFEQVWDEEKKLRTCDDTNMAWAELGYKAALRAMRAASPAVQPEAVAELVEALRVARDHIEMDALRISHCKDAALITDALAKHGQPQGGSNG